MGEKYYPHAAAVVTIRNVKGSEFLLQRRSEAKLKGVWNYVAGGIAEGENAIECVQRELKEEVGLTPSELYLADISETYYDRKHHCMRITPVFVAIVESDAQVELDPRENDKFEWGSCEELATRLMPMQQNVFKHVQEYFINQKPNAALRVDVAKVGF